MRPSFTLSQTATRTSTETLHVLWTWRHNHARAQTLFSLEDCVRGDYTRDAYLKDHPFRNTSPQKLIR